MNAKYVQVLRENNIILYPLMTLNDHTEIVHSEVINCDGKERVKICIERPYYC